MFDFQKEVIINPRFMVMDGPVKLFRVLRCADYRKEGLVEGVIYKTPAEKGQVASAAFNLPTKEGTYRVVIGITLIGKYLADYAMPWSNFGKAVLAEFEVSAEDLEKTKELQEKMIKAIEMAIPENYRYVRVSAEDSGKVLVSCTDSHQVITVAELQEQRGISCPDSCTEKQYVTVDEAVEVTKNKMEIGAAWLQENLRFPSYPNIRYAALNEEEYPVNGGLYTQFSFLYCMPRKGLHGQGTVGQALKSVTTHTFYVLSSLVDKFEEDLKKVFGDDSIKVVSPDNTELINIEFVSALKVSVQDINEGKAIIKANVSGPAVSPNLIKYSIKEEDSKYQIDNDGKLTVKKGQTAAEGDKFTVKASYGNAVAEQEFTVGA